MLALIVVLPILFTILFYAVPFGDQETAKQFVSVATFIFAIFTGFFIARQGRRYDDIIKALTQFDGNVSALYRLLGHLGPKPREKMVVAIRAYYDPLLKRHDWSYNLTHKSSLMTSTHAILDEIPPDEKLSDVQRAGIMRILTALDAMQGLRKLLVALYEERIPRFQWILIAALAALLLATISTLPSAGEWFASMVKAASVTAILLVVYMLWALDRLRFFAGSIGEHSANDVLNILSGKK